MTESSWILRNVRPFGDDTVDITVTGDIITTVEPTGTEPTLRTEVVNGAGLLALPGFINTHAHIDKSWWGQPWEPYGGVASTQGRIEQERLRRDDLAIPSVGGIERVLREFLRHGTTAARSHIDVDLGVGLRGIEDALTAVDRLGGAIEVEIVAFPQDGVIRRPGVARLLAEAASMGVANIGGLDPAGIDRNPIAQLDALFDIVDRTGVGVDIHLHDGGELGLFQYELIIDRVLALDAKGLVNISHGMAIGEISVQAQESLIPRLAEAGISWTTCAPVRTQPLPWRQMLDAGVAIGLGTDGIRDIWSPFGDGDILSVALAFAQWQGLRTDEDLTRAVSLATTEAADFVHRDQHDLAVGSRADIVLIDAENVSDALTRRARRETVIAGGRIVVEGGQVTI